MPPSHRSAVTPDSARAGLAVASLDELVADADRPVADTHVALVSNAPGAALLVWGADAVCLAYNRHYRTLTGLRSSALGKPLFRAQPELDRGWRAKLDLALAGSASPIDASAASPGGEGAGGESQLGWMLPVAAPTGARGVLGIFMDATALMEPARRLLGALAQDLREPLIGIQVVSERLARLPKPTRERCVEDMDRVLDHSRVMDRLIDDMGAFSRRSGAAGARLSLRPGDLASIVRLACERIDRSNTGKAPALRVNTVEVQGLWDDDAILRVLSSLVASARQSGETVAVTVELASAGREGAILTVKDDGAGLLREDAEQLFEPWKRGIAPGVERRRRGMGMGLFLARELVSAHGGRIIGDRPPGGGFAARVILPIIGGAGSAGPVSRTLR